MAEGLPWDPEEHVSGSQGVRQQFAIRRVYPFTFDHTAGYSTEPARDYTRMLADVYDSAVYELGEGVCGLPFMDKLVRMMQVLELVDSGVDLRLAKMMYYGANGRLAASQ